MIPFISFWRGTIGSPGRRGSSAATSTQVAYTPTTTVTDIEPVAVTWAANEFTVPHGVTSFTFKDGSINMAADWDSFNEIWVIGEVNVYVAYTPTGAVTEIEPQTVSYFGGFFAVPGSVTEFSFVDDGDNWIFIYEEGSWNLYEHIPYESVTSFVSYTEITLVTNIQPGTVTFENNEFTVPGGVEEFSFEDDGETWVFKYESEEWVLYEHVEYI